MLKQKHDHIYTALKLLFAFFLGRIIWSVQYATVV